MEGGDSALYQSALEIAKRLGKKVVVSKDVAGFIGNGHFIREIVYATALVKQLSRRFALFEAIYLVNRVTQDFLLRPMGLFQLIDYVGLDIVQKVGLIMNHYLQKELYDDQLIGAMISAGKLGGQYGDGSPKEGFFHYTDHHVSAIYALEEQRYLPLAGQEWKAKCDLFLGPLPEGHFSWKMLKSDPDSKKEISLYLENLKAGNSDGAKLAQSFLNASQEATRQLVKEGVAASAEEVEAVLKNGFYHLL
jgi:3-hydroxyacyl-CoA dehydrogenase